MLHRILFFSVIPQHESGTLTRFVIAFLTRGSCLLISWLQLPSSVILEPKNRKCVTASLFSPSIYHEEMGPDATILLFLVFNFKLAFVLFFFTLIKRFFSPSLLSAVRVISSTYLRLLMFLPAVLFPACDSSSLAFLLVFSACKLNKQGDNKQPCHTRF